MRYLRAKKARKTLQFYRLTFAIEPPYDIILDGNFIYASINKAIDIRDRLNRLLQESKIRLHVTRSVIQELHSLGERGSQALEFAVKFCAVIEDIPKALSAGNSTSDCIIKYFQQDKNRNNKFFVASQDKELRKALSLLPGIPTIYLNRVILVLEEPSNASIQSRSQIEKAKLSLKNSEKRELDETFSKRQRIEACSSEVLYEIQKEGKLVSHSTLRVKKKAKTANPLSKMMSTKDSRNTNKKKSEKFRNH